LERNKSFNQVVSEYDLMRPQYTENLFQDIIKTAHVKSGSKVLEIGCGTGQATGPFLKTGAYIKALDLGENLLTYSRDKFSDYDTVDFLCADFHTYQVEENNYDLVISATAFHWIKPEIGYNKVFDALKVGGYAALFWNIPSIEKSNG
jgi:ubiquinone/menaquinone biosynthesis C-methylase UbiE